MKSSSPPSIIYSLLLQVNAQLPSRGEYGIEVYGNDPAKDGDTYTHICQYYIHFAPPEDQKNAFYQESPERRGLAPGQSATAMGSRNGYQPDSSGVSRLGEKKIQEERKRKKNIRKETYCMLHKILKVFCLSADGPCLKYGLFTLSHHD